MKKQLTKLLAVGLSVMTIMSSMSLPVYAEDNTSSYLYEQAGIVLDEETPYTMGDGVEGYLSTDGTTLVVKGSGSLTDTSSLPTGIVTIYIESGITSIESTATFKNQYQTLKNVYFAEGLQTITGSSSSSSALFYNCTLIEEIVLPDSLTSITGYVFYNCNGLESLTLGENLTTFEDKVFNCGTIVDKGTINIKYLNINCKNVTESIHIRYIEDTTQSLVITFGDSVETIQKLNISTYGSINCDVESITIPNSVTYIASNAFKGGSNYAQDFIVYTNNQIAKDYDWEGQYFTVTFISTSDMQDMTVTMTVSADVTTTDVTIPIDGLQIAIDSNGDISSSGMIIESNTSFPVTISVDSVETLTIGDTTNSLNATNTAAPQLVSADKYTVDEWNAMSPIDTRKEIALAIKQVDINDDGTVGTELTEATTDSLKVTTPVQLGNLGENKVLAHLESGYGEASTCAVNIETDTAYTNYGKAWSGEEDITFRYLVTLEISADQQ